MAQVGKASISFEADTSKVTGELTSSMDAALAEVAKAVESTMAQVELDFGEAGGALAEGVDDGGEKAAKSAGSAADKIAESFKEAAGEASGALNSVDGDGFSKASGKAASAGASIASSISEAAAKASSAIDDVDGDAFDGVAADAEKASSTIGDKVSDAARRAAQAIKDIGADADAAWEQADRGAFNFMGTLGKVAGAAAALAGPAVIVQKGWSRLTALDEAEAKLGALGNSAQDIEIIMDNAMESVTGTAFGFGDAAGQAATLVAAGVKPGQDLERVLGLVADSASVAGVDLNEMGNIFGKVAASGKMQGDVMQQLMEKQIGLLPVLAEQYGVSNEEMQKMISDGKVGFEDFTEAMETMMGGGAEKMGKTVRASFQNVGAAAGRLGEVILKPIFQAAPGFLTGVSTGLGAVTNLLKDVIAWFGEGSLAADILKAAFVGIGTAAGVAGVLGLIGWMKEAGVMLKMIGQVRHALKLLNFSFILSGPGLAIAAIAALVAGFVILWNKSETFREFWIGLWDSIQTAVEPVVNSIQATFNLIKLAWDDIVAAFSGDTGYGALWYLVGGDNADALVNKVAAVGDTLRDLWELGQGVADILFKGDYTSLPFGLEEDSPVVNILFTIRDLVIGVWDALKGAGESVASSAWETLVSVFDALVSVGSALWGAFLEIGKAVWGLIQTLAPVLLPILKIIGGIIGGMLLVTIGLVIGALHVLSFVFKAVAKVIEVVAKVIGWLVETFLAPLISILGKVAAFLIDVLAEAFTWVGEKIGDFVDWLLPALSGLWEGLQAGWEAYGQPVIDFIVAAFNMWWESTKLIFRLMGAAFEVLWTAMQIAWDTFGKPIVDGIVWVFQRLWDGLKIVFGWVQTAWEFLWAGVTAVYNTVIAPVIGWIANKFEWLKNAIFFAFHYIKMYIGLAGDKMRALWAEYVQPMIDKVVGGFNKMLDKIKEWKDKVIGWFSDAGSWLYESGKNIVQGLIDGATSLLSKMGDFFLDALPGWVKDPFKKALGIHSPSRVFAEYGQNIGEGLIHGLEAMSEDVQAATSDLAGRAQSGFDASAITPAVNMPGAAVSPSVGVLDMSSAMQGMPEQVDGVVAPAMDAMGNIIAGTRAEVIDPAMTGIETHMSAMSGLFATSTGEVINPAVTGMGANLALTRAAVVDPAMWGIESHLGAMTGKFVGNINGMINPAVGSMGTKINAVKVGLIDPAFAGIRSGLSYVVAAFANGARDVGIHMQTMRRNTADPVRFTMNTIFSDGLVEMWNSVSDLVGTKKMPKKIAHFATGGYVQGPGGPTDDLIPAMLSNREYVINAAAVERIGVSNLDALNYGGVTVGKGAFNSRGAAKELMNDATFQAVASRFAGGGVVKGSPAWNQLRRGYVWAQQLSGRPYVLGGDPVGGGGTDCSGYMSSIADRIGGGPGHRQWATMAFNGGGNAQYPTGPQGFVKGLAAGFSIGVTNGGMYGGHTAGTIGGVEGLPATNVESGGSPSLVKFGAGAAGANDGYFRTHYHLPIINDAFKVGSGSGGASMAAMVSEMIKPYQDKIKKQVAAWSAKPGFVNGIPAGVADKLGGAMDKKINVEAEKMLAAPGGSGAERWRPMAIRAMQRVGFNWRDPAQVNAMIAQIASESGGIPNRAQEIVDVNGTGASAGLGLLQIIPGTFAANRDPALPNDRTDPFANMVAALRYYKGRYGMDLTTMWGHGHGYHAGGLLPEGQGMFAKTALGRERVLSPRQTAAFEDLVTTLGNSRMPTIRPAQERGEATGGGLRTREVHVTQNIYSNDPKGAADRASDRLTSLIV